jgi:hypothetical protein
MMLEWPGRCLHCDQSIEDWTDAGLYNGRWIHKACWSNRYVAAQTRGLELAALRSPIERSSQLELPLFIFLLLFHFGLGGAVVGWVLLTQTDTQGSSDMLVFALGMIAGLIGMAGIAVNIMSRRHIEAIRQSLDAVGGWKPGR